MTAARVCRGEVILMLAYHQSGSFICRRCRVVTYACKRIRKVPLAVVLVWSRHYATDTRSSLMTGVMKSLGL